MQSQGLGKILLNYAKDKRNKLYLNVYQKNARAISFYKREEFEIQHSGLDEATGEKDYVMTWQHKSKFKFVELRKSEFVERFPELSLFYRLFSPLNSEMICIFPYFCPYAESAREIRGIFVALHINNWFSEPILI